MTTINPRDVLPQPTRVQIRAAATCKIQRAMQHIENAQNELHSACAELSAITHGAPMWRATGKLADKVHAFWYRVKDFSHTTKYRLDPTHVELLARVLAERGTPRAPSPPRQLSRVSDGEVEGMGGDAVVSRQ